MGFSIPVEMMTMGVSTVLGALGKFYGMKMEHDKLKTELMLMAARQGEESRTRAMEGPKQNNSAWVFTRRTIALTLTFSIVLLPKLMWLMMSEPPKIIYGQVRETTQWLFFDTSMLNWTIINGFPITPIETHAFAAVIGLYFGASMVSKT